jgi:uncharacterized NAD(P)/FAD-binding protein YdhS
MCPNLPRSIVIVGGGLSGALVAANVLSRASAPVRVTVIDPSDRIGEGVAFHTRHPEHYLNVRVRSMSIVAGHPDHLARWLASEGGEPAARWGSDGDPEAFLPRGLYAEYIHARIKSVTAAARGSEIRHARGSAIGVTPGARGATVHLEDGTSVEGSTVVLALGNPLPVHPVDGEEAFYRSESYVRDPWSDRALSGIGPDAPVLILGCGLTMVDTVISLARLGHRGAMVAVSRRGLVARASLPRSTPAWPLEFSRLPGTMRALVRFVREEVSRAAGQGVDWRSVIDSLRPHTQALWQALPDEERRRFLRHARVHWEIYRHRAAPANMTDIDAIRASGRLVVRAGRIHGFRRSGSAVGVAFLSRGASAVETIRVERVINATGPEGDFRKTESPLVQRLMRDGLVRPGPHGFGLDATPEGVLLDAKGAPSPFLATLGPPIRGVLWETLAVPEIREQAARIAARFLAG